LSIYYHQKWSGVFEGYLREDPSHVDCLYAPNIPILLKACMDLEPTFVKILLDCKANIEICNEKGESLFKICEENAKPKQVRFWSSFWVNTVVPANPKAIEIFDLLTRHKNKKESARSTSDNSPK
jgi:hypothetical protein